MAESIYQYLAADHDRLDGLLDRATTVSGVIDMVSYDAFRSGILRHIAMEQRTVFPAIVQFQKGRKAAFVERLRRELDNEILNGWNPEGGKMDMVSARNAAGVKAGSSSQAK